MNHSSYVAPSVLPEALAILAGDAPETDIVAGGTDLVVAARIGKRPLRPRIMAIHGIHELRCRDELDDGSLRIGALTTHGELRLDPTIRDRYAALADGSALVGSYATQNVGTVGGNVANASPAMDTGSPLLCFDTTVELASTRGSRLVPLGEFLRGPGVTAREPDELVTALRLPAPPAGRVGSAYLRHDYRAAMEVAVVGAGVLLAVGEDDVVTDTRLALTAVGPTCIRVPTAEQTLIGRHLHALPFDDFSSAASRAAHPIDDLRASARYRVAMSAVFARRALKCAIARIDRPSGTETPCHPS